MSSGISAQVSSVSHRFYLRSANEILIKMHSTVNKRLTFTIRDDLKSQQIMSAALTSLGLILLATKCGFSRWCNSPWTYRDAVVKRISVHSFSSEYPLIQISTVQITANSHHVLVLYFYDDSLFIWILFLFIWIFFLFKFSACEFFEPIKVHPFLTNLQNTTQLFTYGSW